MGFLIFLGWSAFASFILWVVKKLVRRRKGKLFADALLGTDKEQNATCSAYGCYFIFVGAIIFAGTLAFILIGLYLQNHPNP